MRRTFLVHHGRPTWNLSLMILILASLLLWLPCLWAAGPITPSGLNTQVSDPITVGAQTQYNITGGTRPGGGANLFHSFGEFGIPTNNIANFLNEMALPTDNILGRVTGVNESNILGTIQTTGFGNANLFLMNPNGFLFGPNATVNVGGMATFTTADYMRLTGDGRFNANPNTTPADLLTAAPVAAFGFIVSNPHAINFEGGQLTVANGTGITLIGGDINNLVPDSSSAPSSITAPGRLIQLTSVAGPGEVAADTAVPEPGMALGNITFGQDTILSTAGDPTFGGGSGGAVSIRSGQFVATGAKILTGPAVGSMGQGGAVTIATTDSASLANSIIDTSSVFANGNGGAVSITASKLTLQDSTVRTNALGDGLTAITGGGGPVNLAGTSSVSLMNSSISTETSDTAGNAGAVTIATPTLTIQGGTIATGTSAFLNPLAGNAGDIEITAANVSLTDFATLQSFASSPETFSRGGTIRITATENILVANGTSILTTTASQANAGNIEMVSKHVTIMGQSALGSETLGPGGGGLVKITGAENIALESGSRISTNSAFAVENQGPAGHIEFNTQQLTVTGGSQVSSSTFHNGAGGTITVQGTNSPAQSVLISGAGSGIFSTAESTGAGGNIFINANSVAMTNGSSVSASSTGPGNAGNISINAGNQFAMTNSSVTTQADAASGGAIKITTNPSGWVQLTNSLISASVLDGTGGGGSVDIDPQYVILLNSQILAQAVHGPGGNITITITNGGLFLPDANSVISASSQFGVNGAVTIQSPNAPSSGQIQPLGTTPLHATSLLNQHCAALADGQFSSFTVGGRDSLPTEPGRWLTSPLALAPAGVSAGTVTVGDDQMPVVDPADETTVLSLRQIVPAGFLTQSFAVELAASCQS